MYIFHFKIFIYFVILLEKQKHVTVPAVQKNIMLPVIEEYLEGTEYLLSMMKIISSTLARFPQKVVSMR